MLARVRAYAEFARCSFQRRAAYRLANWSGIAVNFFFFVIQAQVFLAFFRQRAEVAGWTAPDAVLYFATSEALMMVLGVISPVAGLELAERIRRGDIAVDLVRPVRPWARFVAEAYGTAAYYVLARTIVLYAGAVLLYDLPVPWRAEVLAAPLAVVLAVGVNGLLLYLGSTVAYWTEQAHAPLGFIALATMFFGGVGVPLDFYPDAVRALADVLPFRAVGYTPIAIASGKLVGGGLAFALAHQLAWLLGLAWIARRLEARGLQHLAVAGG
jgi:ABC-2 type transport system permease protein